MDMVRIKRLALRTVVMFNNAFADIIGFNHPDTLERIVAGSLQGKGFGRSKWI
ncbi:MAG: hypothetical protein HC933_04280 [Pleurocapsa sp. SU_196_0]|nr:hypothetical protein [Pleurocapsa sp. SU_196_0]